MKTFSLKKSLLYLLVILLFAIYSSSCNSDDVGGNLYTFTRQMLGEFLKSDTAYSEFYRLLDISKVNGLLNSYGEYTCFAPTNAAMYDFYRKKGKQGLEDFLIDTLKLIAYDHLLQGARVRYVDFIEGRQSQQTMSGRYLTVNFAGPGETYVNKTSLIVQKDISLYNGIVHSINRALDPSRLGVAEVIATADDDAFSLFYDALVETGLVDSLLKTEDESYSLTPARIEDLKAAVVSSIASDQFVPDKRKYGYTVLLESNATFASKGITDMAGLRALAAQLYPGGDVNPVSRSNSLNRFIAYHLINKELSSDKLISAYDSKQMSKSIDMYEYIEPMLPNSLIEVMIKRSTSEANLLNYNPYTQKAVRVTANSDNDASNGVFHEIDDILAFTPEVENLLSTKRLRFDIASFFPELSNNNMRGQIGVASGNMPRYAIAPGYFDRLACTEQTTVCYAAPYDYLMNFQGDEFIIIVNAGSLYDITFTTPPVPAGTYEVRFSYQSNGRRGVAQFYFDDIPCGVPVNLNRDSSDPGINYVIPGNDPDDPMGYENDKTMRNLGYMKGPNSYKAVNEGWYSGISARYNGSNLRKILGTFPFAETQNHRMTVRGLSGGQFQIDFIEFVPTSLLESEDIN
jgi:uncharacterized surface protein with fasciclin (FAS1) repeats